jgi:outer membrane protein assembly factor BamB
MDGAATGNAMGAVSSTGLYTAPAVVPSPSTVTLRARSVADPTKSGFASVNLTSPGEDWPKFGRDLANSGVSGETAISSANVSGLQVKWEFDTGSLIDGSPVIATVGGIRTVYIGSLDGVLHALDADTGKQIWSFQVDRVGACAITPSTGCLLASTPAVEHGIVYVGSGGAYVYALDGATGSLVWKTQLADPILGYTIYTSPAVYNGLVYVGLASENGQPCVVGRVVALNTARGAIAWNFTTIDQSTCPSGTCVGAGVWSSPVVDTRFDTVFVGTGNSGAACVPLSSNAAKYPNGILGLDPATGTLKSFFQQVPNDTNDRDVGAPPTLHHTQTLNECTGEDKISYWVTVGGKNGTAHTHLLGTGGLQDTSYDTPLGDLPIIARATAVPFSQSTPCGQGNLQLISSGNNIFALTTGDVLAGIRQSSDGTVSRTWTGQISPCPNGFCGDFSSPAAINDLVFFGADDNMLHAVDTNGKSIWQFATHSSVISSPAISHGSVYFASYNGIVYCLSF